MRPVAIPGAMLGLGRDLDREALVVSGSGAGSALVGALVGCGRYGDAGGKGGGPGKGSGGGGPGGGPGHGRGGGGPGGGPGGNGKGQGQAGGKGQCPVVGPMCGHIPIIGPIEPAAGTEVWGHGGAGGGCGGGCLALGRWAGGGGGLTPGFNGSNHGGG